MTRRRQRGFSLSELMVALLVSALVIAAAMALMTGQQRAYRAGSDERQLQESARVAMDDLTSNLRNAGFGLDPALGLDLGPLPFFVQDKAPSGSAPSAPAYQCPKTVECRDRIDGPDELVFRLRDPMFGHRMTTKPDANVLYLDGPLPGGLQKGQVLQLTCGSGAMVWAYVTVSANVDPSDKVEEIKVPLEGGNGASYGFQNDFLADGCFQAVAPIGADEVTIETAAKVLKVDLYRYFVQDFGGRPYLMLDQGLGADAIVAPDVEDLQVTYYFPNAAAGAQRRGDVEGQQLTDDEAGMALTAPAGGFPSFTTGVNDPVRANHFPANVRAVRVSLVVRAPSAQGDPGLDVLPAVANRPALGGRAAHRRFVLETTTPLRNLDARGPYYPTWSDTSATLNKGGG